MDDELTALRQQSLINRSSYNQKLVAKQQERDRSQEEQVEIVGFDASIAAFKIKSSFGQISFAKPISNSGYLHIGAKVSANIPSSTTTFIDATPRG